MADVVNNGAVNKTKWGIEADKLNAKFNSIDSDLTTINGRLDGVDSDLTTVNTTVGNIDGRANFLETLIQELSIEFQELLARVEYIESEIGSNLDQSLQLFAFWSKETDTDYYVSLEDDSPYYSLTEKK